MDEARIEQFRKMTEADPDNELGHFSLGKALLDLGDFVQAVPALERAVGLAPQNSRAYHLLALAQKGADDKQAAIDTLRKGYEVATRRGDMIPRREMVALMKTLGETPPADAEAISGPVSIPAGDAPSGDMITCSRCGKLSPKMVERPFKGPLGERVWAEVCTPCWREWIPTGTKVINELRLNFADPKHAETYDQHMKEYLNLT